MAFKVTMVDYIGSTYQSRPAGHALKVIQNYQEQLSSQLDIELLAPQSYLSYVDIQNKKKLAFCRKTTTKADGFHNLLELIKCFCNIQQAFKTAQNDTIWFYNVDQFLFLYLFFHPFCKKKIIITLFTKKYPKKYHNFCMEKVLPKLDLIVSTNPEIHSPKENCIYTSDYFYDEKRYLLYEKPEKENKIVCLGTVGSSKKVLELVEAMNDTDRKLEIYGAFYDEEYYQKVEMAAGQNIKIENRYLSDEEYLTILGSAKYCVLPYDDQYENITSGVLLETIFLHSIPITSKSLLDKMQISGLGYDTIEKVNAVFGQEERENEILMQNEKLLQEKYAVSKFQNELYRRFQLG